MWYSEGTEKYPSLPSAIRSHLKFISFLLLFLSFSYRDDILVFLSAMFKKISKKTSAKENDVDIMLKFS